jgi:glycine/D-amino acid oxidase-like deaminating enzyme
VTPAPTAQAVICGAGIAGVSTAYYLAVEQGMSNVVLCDPRPPLTLTSDKSTECYRNWWPNPSMVSFMDRSIDLLEMLSEQSDDAFSLNRRGYLYVHGEDDGTDPNGAEAVSREQLADEYTYVTNDALRAIRVPRAGWFSAQQLGAWMLDRARERGATVLRHRVTATTHDGGHLACVELDDGTSIATPTFINAAGPMLAEVSAMVGADLPVHNELHLKVAFKDALQAVPRDAPMLIWADPQRLDLTDEERSLCVRQGRRDLLGRLPAGCHCRPEGGFDSEWVLGLWEYRRRVMDPVWPVPIDPMYAETVLRGLTTMIPKLSGYRDRAPESVIDGGYYTKTTDNLPLIGAAGAEGAFVCGGLSGYGVMAACAAGELAAMYATGAPLPDFAAAFDPTRYDDPAYTERAAAGDTGQI